MNGLEVTVEPDFQIGVTNKTPEFLAKFPLGKVPAFESGDGKLFLTEAQAIARYVAESGPKASQLLGADPQTRALIEMWSCFAEQELALNVVIPMLMTVANLFPYEEAKYQHHVSALERALKRLEVGLQGGKKYLVGEELTLADIMILGPLQVATKFLMDAEMRKEVPSVEPYLKGLLEIPELKKAFGDLQVCEKRVKKE